MADALYTITMAAQKSGLSTHAIRIWEKRYQAVSPDRSGGNRRRYSAAEIERLRLLSNATQAGHRIGDIAKLSEDKLRELAPPTAPAPPTPTRKSETSPDHLALALRAVSEFDRSNLINLLDSASIRFGQHGLLENLIGPLAIRIGELWQEGAMTAAHEHFATATISTYLLHPATSYPASVHVPRLLVVTPAGQLHELGAAIVAAAARDLGWAIIYLGANLPAAEIASAAMQHQVQAVALSIVYPGDDPMLPMELKTLRKLLPAHVQLIAGGRAASAYGDVLTSIGATHAVDLKALYTFLDRTHRSFRQASTPENRDKETPAPFLPSRGDNSAP